MARHSKCGGELIQFRGEQVDRTNENAFVALASDEGVAESTLRKLFQSVSAYVDGRGNGVDHWALRIPQERIDETMRLKALHDRYA